MSSKVLVASSSAPSALVATPAKSDTRTLAAAFCRAFTVHPATADKSPEGIASRVARGLNRALGHKSAPHGGYWTRLDVAAFCSAEGITLGS